MQSDPVRRWALLVVAAVLSASGCGAATARPEPAATASAPASTVVATTAAAATMSVVQLDLLDVSRPTAGTEGVPASTTRALPTTVYLPAANEPAPLVVLAHGAGGAPEKFTELAGFWADSGYVVAAPRFPLTNDRVGAVVVADFPEQGRDVRFVIDEVLAASGSGSGPLAGRVDAERIGLFGLSLGSLTVWSATMDAPGEPRVDALVQSDGATFVADDRIGAVPFPVLVAHSDVDTIFPYAETVARYDLLPVEKYFLTLHGAAHASVGENTDTPADAAYQEATTAFWDRTLRGRPDTPFPAPVAGVTSFVVGTTEPLPETE